MKYLRYISRYVLCVGICERAVCVFLLRIPGMFFILRWKITPWSFNVQNGRHGMGWRILKPADYLKESVKINSITGAGVTVNTDVHAT